MKHVTLSQRTETDYFVSKKKRLSRTDRLSQYKIAKRLEGPLWFIFTWMCFRGGGASEVASASDPDRGGDWGEGDGESG